ncbi:MAG: SpoIID/LytB domain-containing protein [Bacteriovoracaceae bacterium]|nr:SpoIID/LytB domain-containing protein [Bacteriovoracaceae bacterium]
MIIFIFIFLFITQICAYAYADIPHINVLLGQKLSQVTLKGQDLKKKIIANNSTSQQDGFSTFSFNCGYSPSTNVKSSAGFLKDKIMLASVSSPTGYVSWQNRDYQGDFVVTASLQEQKCDLIQRLPLESYISSLLAKEMNGSWSIEALKAQAVLARSYALLKKKQGTFMAEDFYHLTASEKDQVAGALLDKTQKTTQASRETQGEVLVTDKGSLASVFFHSQCGGKTLKPEYVWQNKVEGYQSVPCPRCHENKSSKWSYSLAEKDFITTLKNVYQTKGSLLLLNASHVFFIPDRTDNALMRFYDDEKNMKVMQKAWLRSYLGRKNLKSNYFKVSKREGRIFFEGKGLGHGVGMCQMGALSFAKKGWNYHKILSYYFPNYKIKKVY